MTTIKELHRDRRIVSQNRGRAIAAEFNYSEPFTTAQMADIAAVDALMTQEGLRGAKEGVARFRRGGQSASNPVQDFTQQVEEQGAAATTAAQQSVAQSLDLVAQNEAAGILTTKNLMVAHYLTAGTVPDPGLQHQIDQSSRLVENVLLSTVPAFNVGNLIQQASIVALPSSARTALPEATPSS
ncbi:hypothetical protein H6F43_03630 [Leptolyngbya sp. FACHB-36]|uniref:hypothetical protein n=1 Tax=Leptolyngbya sp. FACHB-36 TaxID=2692808 RepID=UPI0016818673|nr:hypothetical protein [Leptolyngbya sp. FACHB-36]MBD2019272.1 hypothetical protein [Leptolyngbya sp. FACHB-36]